MTDLGAFTNHLPVRIWFGEGRSRDVLTALGEVGARRVLVMTDEGIDAFNPAAATLLDVLVASEFDVTRMDKPAGEPTIAMVDAATEHVRLTNPDAIVALGGGSVIDTAKAARLCDQLNIGFAEFVATRPTYPTPTRVLMALPTSAGTGSEVSGGAVIADPEAGTKNGIAHPLLRAQYAIVDPELSASMPPSMTANTGIDAMAQAIAAMVAHVRTPIGDAIALEAIRMMAPALPVAFRDGTDRSARAAMACGAMMAGLAMNISDCTAEHALGQAIGGVAHVPHGLTIGLVVAETLERERHHVPEILERVADALGAPRDGTSDGSRCITAVKGLLGELNFPVLSSLGITEESLADLADLALADYFITMSPVPWTKEEVVNAFASALALTSR